MALRNLGEEEQSMPDITPHVEAVAAAAKLLDMNPNMPLKIFWETLASSFGSLAVVMAIVTDPRCGTSRRSCLSEGAMNTSHNSLNCTKGGATPLMLATVAGRTDVMKSLLAVGADINAKEDGRGYTAIHLAVREGNLAAVEILLANEVHVSTASKYGDSSLHLAAIYGEVAVIRMLLAKDADVETVAERGETPLHKAALHGKVAAVDALISYGANVNGVNTIGSTPLHQAAFSCYVSAIDKLITFGGDVCSVDKYNRTPLHNAASSAPADAIEALIAEGADVNAVDMEGITPLHVAALRGNVAAIEVLVAHKANPFAADNKGYTPLNVFQQEERNYIVEIRTRVYTMLIPR